MMILTFLYCSRNSLGVHPFLRLKMRLKLLMLFYPHLKQISPTLSLVSMSMRVALPMRMSMM